jgi:kynurenine formamidase
MMKTFLKACAIGTLVVIAVAGWAASRSSLLRGANEPADGPQIPANHTVTQADMDRWKVELSNWGRWGKDDQKGTLNLITPGKRKEAAGLVKDGVAVSLAHDVIAEKALDNPDPFENTMVAVNDVRALDKISVAFHGISVTHMDALAHHYIGGKMYNGFPQSEYVTMEKGALKGSIINVKEGVFTRAILMDIPRLKGVEYLEPGTPIYAEDLEAWEKKAGVKVSPGDALLIRTGRWVVRAKIGPSDMTKRAGLDASVIPWLRQRDVAVLGSEVSLSVIPFPPTTQVTNKDDYLPVHNFVIAALGVTVLDNLDLDALSEACAARKRWSFLLTVAPIALPRGTGSPVNPTVLF